MHGSPWVQVRQPAPVQKLYGPPGFDVASYVEKLCDPRMTSHAPESALWRRQVCQKSPILFGLVYFLKDLTLSSDGELVTELSEFHIELAMSAKRWMRADVGPKEIRDAWVAPRSMGKTSWIFVILAAWALAFGHRKFIVVYSDIEKTAKDHLKNLKLEFSRNDNLRRDFPRLCTPLRAGGRAVMNDSFGYMAKSGAAIAVRGMNSATLGVKLRERRPDGLWLDDPEPKAGNYSAEQKDKRLTDLIEAILPCNLSAVVQIVGTTVMHGSIIHDITQGKPWVAGQNIAVHHFRGIAEDPETGEERSCWPRKWSLEYLRSERDGKQTTRSYAKNFENEPVAENGTYWDDDDIRVDSTLDRHITDRVLVIDPATKSKRTNDETGIAMVGWCASTETAVVERVMGVRLKPAELRELVHSIVRNNRIKLIVVDTTNGGDHVLNTLEPLPPGVKMRPVHLRRSKADRFADLHDRYQRRLVVHARTIPGVEAQMKSYPHVLHDDRIDVVCLAVEYFHGELPAVRVA